MPASDHLIEFISENLGKLTIPQLTELASAIERWGVAADTIPLIGVCPPACGPAYGPPPVPYCPTCGVIASGPHACPGPQRAAPAYGPPPGFHIPEEDRFDFTISLTDVGPQKFAVIRLIREVCPGWGLAEAKKLVDDVQAGHPTLIRDNLRKSEAELLRHQFEAVGAKVRVS
jgi:ribosomal protein L7/L12